MIQTKTIHLWIQNVNDSVSQHLSIEIIYGTIIKGFTLSLYEGNSTCTFSDNKVQTWL